MAIYNNLYFNYLFCWLLKVWAFFVSVSPISIVITVVTITSVSIPVPISAIPIPISVSIPPIPVSVSPVIFISTNTWTTVLPDPLVNATKIVYLQIPIRNWSFMMTWWWLWVGGCNSTQYSMSHAKKGLEALMLHTHLHIKRNLTYKGRCLNPPNCNLNWTKILRLQQPCH